MTLSDTKKLIRFDWALKYMLRDKANFDILEGFLSEVLKQNVVIEEILESESNQDDEKDKFNRVDLLAKAGNDERVLIEVQASDQLDYVHRILYGASKLVVENLDKGQKYHQIKKVYSVSVLFFTLGDAKDYVYHGKTEFHGLHTAHILGLTEKQQEYYRTKTKYRAETLAGLLPEHYLLMVDVFNQEARDGLDEWIYALKNEEVKPTFRAKGIQAAGEKMRVMKLTEEQRKAYDNYVDQLRSQASIEDTAHFKGFQEGEETAQTKLVRKLHAKGKSIQEISHLTDLPEAEVRKMVESPE